MPTDVRAIAAEEVAAFERCLGVGFGEITPPDHVSTWRPLLDPQRCLAAFDGDDMVGGAAAITLGITVPGTVVPAGAVVSAAILPTHRRQGLLRTMLQRQLHDMHDRGEALSALWVSEWPIYGRFGYGVATFATRYDIDRAHAEFARPPCSPAPGRVRFVDRETALAQMPAVYDRVRPARAGAPERPTLWWHHLFSDTEWRRKGFSPLQFVLHDTGSGDADGYAAYRIKADLDEDGLAASEVRIMELIAATPEANEALWRSCLSIDMVTLVQARNRPIDDAVIHLLADGRRLRRRIADGMWIRLVDVPAAAATEVVVDPPSLALGVPLGSGNQVNLDVTVRNVSRRRLEIAVDPASGGSGARLEVLPHNLVLGPGESAAVGVFGRVQTLPSAPGGLSGALRIVPKFAAPFRVRWAIAVPLEDRPLLTQLRLSQTTFAPSDANPAVLSVVAGRVDGTAESPQLLPLEELRIDLFHGDRLLGTIARVRDLLPGLYAFGLTGRGPRGRQLPPGGYSVRLMATPVSGADDARTIRFHIR